MVLKNISPGCGVRASLMLYSYLGHSNLLNKHKQSYPSNFQCKLCAKISSLFVIHIKYWGVFKPDGIIEGRLTRTKKKEKCFDPPPPPPPPKKKKKKKKK